MLSGEATPPPVLNGPFSPRALEGVSEVLTAANHETGLTFSVYVGELAEPVRLHAEQLHDQLADPSESVLLAISPNQRVLEIVTGKNSGQRLTDQQCALVALSMTSAFSGGDLAGGVITGLRMLADQAHA